ncbi:MAG: RidA family protein [Thermoplasmata archaeon]|nr:RidA family protein [Thermoplasmata archaeon]
MERQRISSGARWEPIVGYSRAVRVGRRVYVAGTTAMGPDGKLVGPGDPAAQTRQAFAIIERALAAAGARLSDVVRTRFFVTDISRWEEYTRVHGELFRTIRPVATMVEVPRLLEPGMMVEVEVDAEIAPRRPGRSRRAPTHRRRGHRGPRPS